MWNGGVVEFEILEVLVGDDFAAFNYFFTLVSIFGIFSLLIGLLVKMLTRT